MSKWNDSRILDVFEKIDISFLDGDDVEADLENAEICTVRKEKWSKKKISMITGIAAGTVALTGVVIYLLRSRQQPGTYCRAA